MPEPSDDQPVPKIPFAKGLRLSFREIIRIVMVGAMLVVVVVMQKPCGEAVSRFITEFDDGTDPQAEPAVEMPKPGNVERIAPTATPEEQKAAVQLEENRTANGPNGQRATGNGSIAPDNAVTPSQLSSSPR